MQRRILIAEDSDVNRRQLQHLLEADPKLKWTPWAMARRLSKP